MYFCGVFNNILSNLNIDVMRTLGYPVRSDWQQFRYLRELAMRFAIFRCENFHMSFESQSQLCRLAVYLSKSVYCSEQSLVFWFTPYECWLLLRAYHVLRYDPQHFILPSELQLRLFEIARKYKFFNIKKL